MKKNIYLGLFLFFVFCFAGFNNIPQNTLEYHAIAAAPSEIKSIKPGIWVSYIKNNKKSFTFYRFNKSSDFHEEYYLEGYNGSGAIISKKTGATSPFLYCIDNGDISISICSTNRELIGNIHFENENKFTITRSEHLLDSETISEDLSPMTFVFLDDTQEFVCETKIINMISDYYFSLPIKFIESIDLEDCEDSQRYFRVANYKINKTQFSVDRLTGILTYKSGQKVDLLQYDDLYSSEE